MKKVLVLSAFFAALIGCQQKQAPTAPAAEAPAAAAPAAPAAGAPAAPAAGAPAAPATDKK